MKKLILPVVIVLTILLSVPAPSNAAYNSSYDWTLSLNTQKLINVTPSGYSGDLTFQLQEAVHSTLTNTTGVELNHSYIWIEINGVKVLAVDPIKPTF